MGFCFRGMRTIKKEEDKVGGYGLVKILTSRMYYTWPEKRRKNVIRSWSHNKKGRQRTPATISHAVRPPSGWPSSVIWSDISSTGDCTSRSYFSFDIELQSLETRTFSTVISKFECCEFLVSQSIERQRWEGKKEISVPCALMLFLL